ncbi:adenosine receptor A1-like [Patiria miniata]|uniref:G-protein coupled receptors family 1 profile domain-containing protein n=1 Tax=Patiria miniata TaxID=46514 RepID=A0A914AU06_PATMI|nr:adenosine receptor A1-like [Patiria miniata]
MIALNMATGESPSLHVNRTVEHFQIPSEFIAAFIGVYAPLILAILSGNSLVLLAVYKEKSLRKRCNFFIVSLSVADFLTGLIGVPTAILGRLLQNNTTCFTATRMVFFTAAFTFSAVSMFQLLAITIERYMAIMTPLVYHTAMTPRRYLYIIIAVWVAGAVVGAIPNFGSGAGTDVCAVDYEPSHAVKFFMLIFALGIPTVLASMGLMYFHIFRKARQQANRIAALRRALHRLEEHQTVQEHRAQMKATKTTAIILGGFAACWMPMALKFSLEVFLVMDSYTILILQTVLEFSAYANSAINPVIYCYRNAEFRTAFCKILAPLKICSEKVNTVRVTPVEPFRNCSGSSLENCAVDET